MPNAFSAVERVPFWLPVDGGALAAWLHRHRDEPRSPALVVLCHPIGYEYSHAHRSLRRLADVLASRGISTLRFDYHGTGNSPGDTDEPGVEGRWIRDIQDVVRFGRSRLAAEHVTLVGLRLGGLLAAAASSAVQADAMVLWSPVAKGRRYMREWEALSLVGGEPDEHVLEAGGFVLTRDSAAEIKKLDLDALPLPANVDVLWVKRDDLPEPDVPGAVAHRVASFEELETKGFADMMAEPHFTKIPEPTVAAIGAWVARVSAASRSGSATESVQEPESPSEWQRTRVDSAGFSEELVWVPGDPPLFGVLTEPSRSSADRPFLILLNAGSVHHVGPNRVYVELSRALAEGGVGSLRMDLRNLGDSLPGPAPDANHPYPRTAVADTVAAIGWVQDALGKNRVVVGGICSGAFTAYRTALTAPTTNAFEYLLINPLTFEWRDGMTLATPPPGQVAARETQYYRGAIRDRDRWRKMMRGDVDFRAIGRFLFRTVGTRSRYAFESSLEAIGARPLSELERELRHIVDRGLNITFVFSSRDPGLELLRSEARRTVRTLEKGPNLQIHLLDGTDHTFSRRRWRRAALDLIGKYLSGESLE